MYIDIKNITGKAITSYIPELAELRINIFREFPYLYDGSLDYEKKYLTAYTRSEETIIVLALLDGRVVGASTGMPLGEQTPNVIKPFRDAGMDTAGIFYFGESVLEKSCRGQGIGVRFFEERERHAWGLGYAVTTFCAVVRPANHPLRPPNYTGLESFWKNRGYSVRPDLKASFRWKDINESAESDKEMMYWMRKEQK